MPVRPVSRLPDRVLKGISPEVSLTDAAAIASDLIETMKASPACVGLAAPQIGILARVIVVDVSGHPKTTTTHGSIALINPVVVSSKGRKVAREGCMSVPDFTANVARAEEIVVRGLTPEGEEQVIATDGFEARAFQHELDHLDGMLILDRVASLATDVFRRKVYR